MSRDGAATLPSCDMCGTQLAPGEPVRTFRDTGGIRRYEHRNGCKRGKATSQCTGMQPDGLRGVPRRGKSVETGVVWDAPVDTELHTIVSSILDERPEYP